jgi:hypothetical protein
VTIKDQYQYCHVSQKIQESFANSNLQAFAQNVGLISQHQYAYVKHSSTTVALIRAVDAWKLAIDKGEKKLFVLFSIFVKLLML